MIDHQEELYRSQDMDRDRRRMRPWTSPFADYSDYELVMFNRRLGQSGDHYYDLPMSPWPLMELARRQS